MSASNHVGDGFPLLTLRQAADRTGMSATTLRRYIKAGRLRARLIPGRYGPEYVVDDESLLSAGLTGRPQEVPSPARGFVVPITSGAAGEPDGEATHLPAPAPPPAAVAVAPDAVPGMLYRELLMKHEHLLVQYGMLRVGGQQIYEVRQEAERRAAEARRAADDLARIRDRHAQEIGLLKARLRQAELLLEERDQELARLRADASRDAIARRNAATAHTIDEEFDRSLRHPGDH